MYKPLLTLAMTTCMFFLSGCGALNPRIGQEIDNNKGRIENLESIQNGMKNEIGKLQQRNEIQDSQIGQMQQGIGNMQSNNENSGIQILSGPGGLVIAVVALFGVCGMMVIIFHYRGVAQRQEKAADILAEKIIEQGDDELVNNVFLAAMHTDVEENILNAIQRQQNKYYH